MGHRLFMPFTPFLKAVWPFRKAPGQEPDYLKTTPLVGQYGAVIGLDQWQDNHGNTFGGDNLHCTGEPIPRDLSLSEAAALNLSLLITRGGADDDVLDMLYQVDTLELGHISPLQTACQQGMGKEEEQKSPTPER